jgi:hypothetical protein
VSDDAHTAVAEDHDAFHPPGSDDPWWQESAWYTFFVPERRLSCTVYPWVRPNQQLLGGGVMMWDDRGRHPWDALHWHYEWNHPYPELGDLRDATFPNGVSLRCVEPLRTYRLGYEGPGCTIDVQWVAITEAHVIASSDYENGAFDGHLDQQGHVTGTIVLAGEEIAVDCHATRDRSWGRRVPHPGMHMGFDVAIGPDAGFVLYADEQQPGAPLLEGIGYLWVDGERAPIVSGRRMLERDGVWPARIRLVGVDGLGREFEIAGTPVNWMACQNIPTMMNLLSLTSYSFTTGTGTTALWGDIQDVWDADEYRAFARALPTDASR